MSMPDWPENNKPPTLNPAAHLSQFTLQQNPGNNAGVNYNLPHQQFPQQPQQQFQSPFAPAVNGLKRQREASDGL
jgi:hypothetical protein